MTTKTDLEQQEFMSRQESRRLVMMGVVLFILVAFMVRGAFDGQTAQESGVPVQHEGSRPRPLPPSIATVRPSQNPAAAVATLEAWERSGGAAVHTASTFKKSDDRLQQVTDLALDVVEEPGFYELLARVHSMSDADIAKAPETQGTWGWQDLQPPAGFDGPKAKVTGEYPHLDRMRGRFVHLRGRFMTRLYQRVLERYPNDSGLAWVWQGTFMADNRGYFVTITDKEFDPKGGPGGTSIALTGAFLKLYSFVPTNPELGVKSFPHLVVKRMTKIPPRKKWDYMFDEKLMAGLVMICVFVFLVFLYALRSRKGEARLNTWRRERFNKRAKSAMPEAAARAKAMGASSAATAEQPAPIEKPGPETAVVAGLGGTEAEPEAPAAEPAAPAAEQEAPAAEAEAPAAETEAPAAEPEAPAAEAEAPAAEPEPAPDPTEPDTP